MRASFGRNGLVVLDALRIIPTGLVLALGWVRTAASEPAPTLGLSLDGVPLSLVALSRHRLADGQQRDAQAWAEGFVLVARLPQPATSGVPRLYLDVGGREFTLPDETIGPPLHDALKEAGRGVAFDLLHHATQHPELAGLAPDGTGGLGAFAGWIEAQPALPCSGDHVHGFTWIDALAAPSGECAVALGLPGPVGPSTVVRAMAVIDGPEGRRAVALDSPALLPGEAGIVLYARLPGAEQLPAPPVELLVQLRHADGATCFRTRPALRSAPDFLAALHDAALRASGGDVMDSFAWLRAVLEDRIEALAPVHEAPEADMDAQAPRVAVLHGIDDPFAVRLAFLAARGIEQRASEVLVLGTPDAAAAVAGIFLERGQVPARSSLGLAAAVRRGTYARCTLVPIDAEALAGAVLDDQGFDRLFARGLPGQRLPLLLHLSAVAGRIDGAETMQRAMHMMRHVDADLPDVGRAEGAAGSLLGDHLAEFWRRAAPAFAAGGAHA